MREYRKATPEDDFQIAEISVNGWRYAYKGIMSDEVLDFLDSRKRAICPFGKGTIWKRL